MNYHVEDIIKESGIPRGRVIVLDGEQGSGKTSMAVAWLKLDYKLHNKERLADARSHVEKLNRFGYKLKLPEHLYFSNMDLTLKGNMNSPNAVHTHFVNVQHLALPNDKFETQYFPWGSVVYVQEADLQLYSHYWQNISDYFRALLKYVRKNNMTIIFDLQDNEALGKQARTLATDLLNLSRRLYTPKRFFGLIPDNTTWYFNWSYPQRCRAAEERGDKTDTKDYKFDASFRYKGDVINSYDSYAEEIYFIKGIEKCGYAVQQHPEKNFSPDGVKKYCEMIPLTQPKKPKKDEKETPGKT